MKMIQVPFYFKKTDASGKAMGVGRSKGRHLSEIITHMRRQVGELKPGRGNDTFMTMGFLFELMVERALQEYFVLGGRSVVKQGETELDGIFMTPDAVNASDGRLEEYKATWKSAKKIATPELFERHFWYWLMQIKAYCYAMGCTKARLVVLFVNNDWNPPEPKLYCFEFEFEQGELIHNWNIVKAHRDIMDGKSPEEVMEDQQAEEEEAEAESFTGEDEEWR